MNPISSSTLNCCAIGDNRTFDNTKEKPPGVTYELQGSWARSAFSAAAVVKLDARMVRFPLIHLTKTVWLFRSST